MAFSSITFTRASQSYSTPLNDENPKPETVANSLFGRIREVFGSTSATTRVQDGLLDLLERLYVLEDRPQVRGLISERPYLAFLLFEGKVVIEQFFPASPIKLSIAFDPEYDESPRLIATIITSLSPQQAFDQLTALDEAWWLNALDRAQGSMSINIAPDEL